MIIELLVTPAFMTLNQLIWLIPTIQLPDFFTGAISGMISIFNTANFFLPMSTLFVILGSIVVFELGMIAFYVVNWVVHRIPLIG